MLLAASAVAMLTTPPVAHADPTDPNGCNACTGPERLYVEQLHRDGVKYMPPEGWVKLGNKICADMAPWSLGSGANPFNEVVAGLVARGASQSDAQNLVLDAQIQLCYDPCSSAGRGCNGASS